LRAPVRVLVVEDSEDDALLLQLELQRAGYETTQETVDTAEALEAALAGGEWDIVVCDYTLPGFTGFDALRIVRRHDPEVPFLLVSGSVGEDLAVEAMRAGANDYLMKDNLARLGPAFERELRELASRRARAAAQAALADGELRFRAVLDAAPTAMVVVDAEGHIVLANAHAGTVFGYEPGELAGQPVENLLPESMRDVHRRHRDRFAAEPRTRRMGIGLELAGRRSDGSQFPAEVGLSTFESAGSLFVIAAVHDVTERQRLETQLRQAQKMEAIGRLAGGVAHDFNNVLTAMNGYADVVLAELPEDSEFRTDIEEIRRAGERAAALTRQLLALGRRQVLAPKVMDLRELVEGLDGMLRRLVGEDVTYRTVLGDERCLVRADHGQLEQVVLNLVVNARDAMPRGGVLTVETKVVGISRPPASKGSDRGGHQVMLAVTDTGMGMDAATKARIFEPFFTTKPQGKGTGLGLATVYGVVAQSGGQISVYSEPDRGTTFAIHLPWVGEEPAAEAPAEAAPSPGGSETILVAEDDTAVRNLTSLILRHRGYTVLEAADASAALDLALRHPGTIDLLLTDVVMPGFGGPALARQLLEAHGEAKVLFMSGYTDDAIVHHGVLEEGVAFLQKPFSPDALARKVRETLDADD